MVSRFYSILLVGLGGFIGAISRYSISLLFGSAKPLQIGTLIVNVLGSFALGVLMTFHAHEIINGSLYILFSAGFLGAFTTMSTFAAETMSLTDQSFKLAFLNFGLMISLVFIGIFLGRLSAQSIIRMQIN